MNAKQLLIYLKKIRLQATLNLQTYIKNILQVMHQVQIKNEQLVLKLEQQLNTAILEKQTQEEIDKLTNTINNIKTTIKIEQLKKIDLENQLSNLN